MPKTMPFYSVNEASKPENKRVHHNNSACVAGRDIPLSERRTGTGDYRLCRDCVRASDDGK